MAVHQKPNGTWFVQYRVRGQNHPAREYFGKGEQARRAAVKRNKEIAFLKANGQAPRPTSRTYLDTLAQEYLLDAKQRGVSTDWLKEFSNLLNKYMLPRLCHRPVDQLEWADVLRMVDDAWGERNVSPRTINRYLGYLRSVFRYGLEHDMVSRHPMLKWKRQTEPKKDFELTVEDLRLIMANSVPHVAWAMELCFETGARPGDTELLSLKWSDVDWEEMTIHIAGTKTEKANRTVPVTEEFMDRLQEMESRASCPYMVEYKSGPVNKLRRGPQNAARRAGIKYRFVMYDIRHLYATSLLNSGADLAAVSALLGHADIETTQRRYYHLMKGEKRRAVDGKPRLKETKPNSKVVRFGAYKREYKT